jgi:hypothetical protein
MKYEVLPTKHIFGARAGCGDVTSPCKSLVIKIEKPTFAGRRFKSPFFSVADTGFEGGCDGRVACAALFWLPLPNPAIRPKPHAKKLF